ncbi:MAG: hypothetical protein LJE95_14975 [Acidobacteria bacterium]|nr:hypothetical protein [Acidobacteriota bacterium]
MTARRQTALAGGLVVAATLILYLPVLRLELMGDAYQMVAFARRSLHRPALLLAALDGFFRPLSNWSLALDWSLWRTGAAGYHASSLVYHAATVVLVLAAARRLGLRPPTAAGVAFLWASSPWAEEAAVFLSSRHQTFLLASWLGLVLAWPGPGRTWTWRRRLLAVMAIAAAVLSKETWVVTPALVLCLGLAGQNRLTKTTVRWTLGTTAAAAIYVMARFALFPDLRGYYAVDPALLAKIPHELAVFLQLERLRPDHFTITAASVLALIATAALAVWGWRRRSRAIVVGSFFLLAPTLPTLLVPFLPQRYLAVPYVGFLLMVGAGAEHLVSALPKRRRRLAALTIAAAALGLAASQVITVRHDLEDDEFLSGWHGRLLAEAREVVDQLPRGRPVVVVRADRWSPELELVRRPAGVEKPQFIRAEDPYGLIDAAALFEWVDPHRHEVVRRYDDWERRFQGSPGAVLIHVRGGFRWAERDTADVVSAARRWRRSGLPLRVIQVDRQ